MVFPESTKFFCGYLTSYNIIKKMGYLLRPPIVVLKFLSEHYNECWSFVGAKVRKTCYSTKF